GETLLEQGKFGAASKRFEAVLSRDSTIALAHFLLGQARMEESRPADAVDHFRSALALQPNASQVRSPLAAALSRMGQTAEGDAQLSRRGDRPVSIDDPRMVRLDSIRFAVGATATTRAEALMQQGNYADAALLLENAVSRNPGSATIHLNLGVARANSGSRSGAILSFRRALELDSTLDKAHYNLGVIALAMNSPESAEASFLAASSGVTFNLDASVELARILRRSGRCGDALGPLRAALSEDPTRLDVRQDLVLCLHKAENDREALDVLERGLTVSPDHLGLTDGIARILATSTNEAIRDGNRALELAEKALSLQQRTETLETAALALSEVGRFDDASRLLVQAVSQADRDGPQEYATHLRSLLATVRDGQPLRTTWPTFVYQR
ncbi:MAG: tetratricopeptide (TPR) repeat protein, partial [Rhodothermales bacterium]